LCCSVTVLADSEFLVYGKDDIEIFCQAFDMDAGEIKYYLSQNNITCLAINGDNTKQIKRSEITDAFSQKVVDFSVLEDSEILNLANQISGFENSKGQVVTVGDIKLLKTEVKTKDSGGEYVLTQFVTVKGGKKITLSFFTAGDGDRAYIETVLKEQFPKEKDFTPFLIGGTVALSIAILVVIVLIILEFRKKED
jgi:hypothetical protein